MIGTSKSHLAIPACQPALCNGFPELHTFAERLAFSLVTFFLAKQKKVACCRATPAVLTLSFMVRQAHHEWPINFRS